MGEYQPAYNSGWAGIHTLRGPRSRRNRTMMAQPHWVSADPESTKYPGSPNEGREEAINVSNPQVSQSMKLDLASSLRNQWYEFLAFVSW